MAIPHKIGGSLARQRGDFDHANSPLPIRSKPACAKFCGNQPQLT